MGAESMAKIRLKRVYEPASDDDGRRILVERLWPRGIKKERAAVDLWLKEAAPSTELRRWYKHDTAKWKEFRRRYEAELDDRADVVGQLVELARKGPLTFVYAARDEEHNSARVLREYVLGRL